MEYIYAQAIWINWKKRKLVKFIFYRKDIQRIIYEYECKIFQEDVKLFSEASYDEINNYYENDINKIKRKIYCKKNKYKKPDRKKMIEEFNQINIVIKELKQNIFNLIIMNKLTNSYNTNLTSPKVKIFNLHRKKKNISNVYFYKNKLYKKSKQDIKKLKMEIGEIKNKRNEILINFLEIKGRELNGN